MVNGNRELLGEQTRRLKKMKKTIWLVPMILIAFAGCDDKAGPTAPSKASADAADPKLAAINSAISKTTPEGNAMIEKAKGMKPELNSVVSSKTMAEMVDDYAKNKGEYNINVIGWEAGQKKSGKWRIILHYRDFAKAYSTAEWEYNPETNKIYPFDQKNAAQFWAAPAEGEKGKKGK